MWRCIQLLSGFLGNDHLFRLSHQSHLSANKGDNVMKPGAVHKSPGIYLTSEENAKRPSMKTRHRLKRSLYLQMRTLGEHSTSRRKKEGMDTVGQITNQLNKKEKKIIIIIIIIISASYIYQASVPPILPRQTMCK